MLNPLITSHTVMYLLLEQVTAQNQMPESTSLYSGFVSSIKPMNKLLQFN